MTHSDIYTKFMIEYDKAEVTSSYPSLTDYEIATILDKAYLALIAQKLTGNNQRRVGLEQDVKAIEDIRPLIKTTMQLFVGDGNVVNEAVYNVPSDMLYYLQSVFNNGADINTTILVRHEDSQKYKVTSTNKPWINNPAVFLEGDQIHVLYDAYASPADESSTLDVTYIKTPKKFVFQDDKITHFAEIVEGIVRPTDIKLMSYALDNYEVVYIRSKKAFFCRPISYGPVEYYANWHTRNQYLSYTTYQCDGDEKYYKFDDEGLTEVSGEDTRLETFECSDTMAEELVNLAIIFAAETVESQRLQTKSNILPLES